MKLTRCLLLSAVLLGFINPLIVSADSIQSNDKGNNNLSEVNETKPNVKQLGKKETSEEPVDSWMPDKDLQTIILKELQFDGILTEDTNVEDITKENVGKITNKLSFDIDSIFSFKGMEYLTQLSSIEINGTAKTNLDYSTLYELKELNMIVADPAQLELMPLDKFKFITNLIVSGYASSDNSDISDTELKEIGGMKQLNHLEMSNHNIVDISALSSLTNLKDLELSYNKISDIKTLSSLTNLEFVNLEYNEIVDVTPLKNLINSASYLNLDYNHIYDLSALVGREIPTGSPVSFNEQDASIPTLNVLKKDEINIENPIKSMPSIETPYLSGISVDDEYIYQYVYPWEGDPISIDESLNLGNLAVGQHKIIIYFFNSKSLNPKFSDGFSGKLTFNINVVPYVTAKYVDEAGNKISDDVVKSGEVGEQYTTEQKDIKNYTFKEVQGLPSGMFTDEIKTVTYVYKATPNTNTPTKPVNPKTNTPTKPANPNTNMPTKPVNPNTNMPTKPVNPNTNMPTKPVNPNTNMPQLPANPGTNMPALPVIDDNGGSAGGNENNTNPGTNNNNSSSNPNNDDNVVDNVINKVQSSLPKTAAEKVTLAGIVSVVLALLAGLVIWKKHK